MMLCGNQPFFDEQVARLVHKVAEEEPTFEPELWGDVSKEAINIIKLMLLKDPVIRPSAK